LRAVVESKSQFAGVQHHGRGEACTEAGAECFDAGLNVSLTPRGCSDTPSLPVTGQVGGSASQDSDTCGL
jgi:hypothetical protein